MKDKIAVMCPSRSRPDKAKECFDSWNGTKCACGMSDFFYVLDDDDDHNYPRHDGAEYIVVPKGRRGMCDPVNFAATKLAKEYKFVMFVGDDHRFRTQDWDKHFRDAIKMNDDVGYVYGNDLLQGINLPTEVMVSSNIINCLGYMILPDLIHLYIDNYWLYLGRGINKIVYINGVIIEHMHYSVGKSEHDEAYKEVNDTSIADADAASFHHWVNDGRMQREVNKLRKELSICEF